MSIFKKTDNFLGRYYRIVPISKFLSPVFAGLFYVSAVCFALLGIIAIIMLFVNVDVDKMLLPPHMTAIKDSADVITGYSLNLGNGIKIASDASFITLSHIKTVIYCRLGSYALALMICAPIFKFLSILFKNIGSDKVLNEQNAKYINYIGMIILFGNTIVTVMNNVFNYIMMNKFIISEHEISFSLDIELFGIVIGMFIVVIGTIYGYACSRASMTKDIKVVD